MNSAIISVGVNDPSIRKFENQYPTPWGMSYNSYLVKGSEKTAVIDTTEHEFADLWLSNLHDALKGSAPDYLIVQHLEPDHSAGIAMLMAEYPELTLVASKKAISMLPRFCEGEKYENRVLEVGDGSTLDLGGGDMLHFVGAPMIHWPEVMMIWYPGAKTFFSADAFGRFGAIGADIDNIAESRRYYFNIVGKYGAQVQSLLAKIKDLPIEHIASLHGPVIDDPAEIVSLYDIWSSYLPECDGTLVAYASIYGNTARVARKLANILRKKNPLLPVVEIDLTRMEYSDALSQAFRMKNIVLAASTYDGGLFTPMSDFLNRLAAKTLRNRRVALIENGSWAPQAARLMSATLSTMKNIEIISPTITVQTAPDSETENVLRQLADNLLA